jgi:hypothetical protein
VAAAVVMTMFVVAAVVVVSVAVVATAVLLVSNYSCVHTVHNVIVLRLIVLRLNNAMLMGPFNNSIHYSTRCARNT